MITVLIDNSSSNNNPALTIIDYINKLVQLGAATSKQTNGALSPAALKDLVIAGNGAN